MRVSFAARAAFVDTPRARRGVCISHADPRSAVSLAVTDTMASSCHVPTATLSPLAAPLREAADAGAEFESARPTGQTFDHSHFRAGQAQSSVRCSAIATGRSASYSKSNLVSLGTPSWTFCRRSPDTCTGRALAAVAGVNCAQDQCTGHHTRSKRFCTPTAPTAKAALPPVMAPRLTSASRRCRRRHCRAAVLANGQ